MTLESALAQLGMLPASFADPFENEADEGIITVLTSLWRQHRSETKGAQRIRAERIISWLENQVRQGATAEFLQADSECPLSSRLGTRLLWWPQGPPPGRRIAIVSSRIGRRFDERPGWFETLRLAAGTMQDGDWLVTADRMTTHRFVVQLSELLALRRIDVRFASTRRSTSRWFEWLQSQPEHFEPSPDSLVLVSPRLDVSSGTDTGPRSHAFPDRDLAVSFLADQEWVLSLRRSGALQSILEWRLSSPRFSAGSVRLLCGEDLVSNDLAMALQERGAVRWYLTTETQEPRDANGSAGGPPRTRTAVAFTGIEVFGNGDWLTHCTRRQPLWPDVEEKEFLEELVLSETADYSPFQTLVRIVKQRRLLASSHGIRGGFSVVCFSAIPPTELIRRRKWQKHRTRWDFEPYGICIRRQPLEKLGAAPVTYGDDATWSELAEERRAWFQKAESRIGGVSVDWSKEEEWRIAGDIDLSQFGPDEAIVFVATAQEADQLQPDCPWPVHLASTS